MGTVLSWVGWVQGSPLHNTEGSPQAWALVGNSALEFPNMGSCQPF